MKTLNKNYWLFGCFFLLYFFVWAACNMFLSLWLSQVGGLSSTSTGIVFSAISIAAICYQPFFGIISDRLGLKKNLLWVFVGLLVLIGPFFVYLFPALLKTNIILAAIVGGAYLGAVFNGGVGVIEAYIEKVSHVNDFEYGRVRVFGNIGAAISTFVTGHLFATNPNIIFWICSIAAILLALVLSFAKMSGNKAEALYNGDQPSAPKVSTVSLFKNRKFWFFVIYVLGVGCIYDVYDQQFPVYFTQFFSSEGQGTEVFGNLVTLQVFLEAIVMILAPFIINKFGAKQALIYAGFIMSFRILGSSIADGPVAISLLKLMHAAEVPILLVGVFKYISANFDMRLSATIYLIGFQFSKQVGAIFLSTIAGNMYDTVGFKSAYLLLGTVAFVFTLISIFTLSGEKRAKLGEVSLS
ncbi:MFS transporter [Paenibacillus polygoni]|uniref:MFS transporter n=1 Tax=Paenibacillus polygoni TaxID=3050112 RepID=A0ABY8X6V4_9BACL|nr:MFS transporter [Paenibacillus polygoni]WIV19181.1 MFS transporter [Paenibacillus polygoni]